MEWHLVGGATLAVLAVTSASGLARASDSAAEARKRFEEGKTLYRQAHDAKGARMKFAQAYALEARPEILWNLAICEIDLGLAEEAVIHLRQYARLPDAKPALTEKIPELVTNARASLGALHVDAPATAAISIDGRTIPRRDWHECGIDLAPGDRVLVVEIQGERFEDIVTIRKGSRTLKHFQERPRVPGVVLAAGELAIASKNAAIAPNAPVSEVPSLLTVDLVRTDDKSSPYTPIFYTTAALGMASLGAGIAFALASQGDADRAAIARTRLTSIDCRTSADIGCAALTSALSDGATNAWISVGAYAASGLLLGAAGWLFYSHPRTTTWSATAGPTGIVLRADY